nr:hypothetical protein [uncultured Tolumonas sp.]
MRSLIAIEFFLLAIASCSSLAEDFSFDTNEYEKKTFEFNGYAEAKQEALRLQPERAVYSLIYPDEPAHNRLYRSTGTLDLTGKLHLTNTVADIHGQASYAQDPFVTAEEYDKIMDGGIRWSPATNYSVDIGKRVQRWGKGYAWNPVGFIERPKDPSDPQTAREGFNMVSMEWTQTLNGDLRTLTLTPVVVPTYDELNPDFDPEGSLNPAAKLYLLAWNTDIDLLWLGKGAKPQSIGLDFSRNLSSELEIHGEWAHQYDVGKNTLMSSGSTVLSTINPDSYLLGSRYLTEHEVTWIVEYLHNGRGYSTSELDSYYAFINSAVNAGETTAQLQKARQLMQSGYNKANSGENYFYLRASVNEPFDWLYTTPALTVISHLDDGSFQVTPEISYTGFSNTELRVRAILLSREQQTEFGEKLSRQRFEIYVRYFF